MKLRGLDKQAFTARLERLRAGGRTPTILQVVSGKADPSPRLGVAEVERGRAFAETMAARGFPYPYAYDNLSRGLLLEWDVGRWVVSVTFDPSGVVKGTARQLGSKRLSVFETNKDDAMGHMMTLLAEIGVEVPANEVRRG